VHLRLMLAQQNGWGPQDESDSQPPGS